MRGVPLRLELGPKDIEKNQCVIVRRYIEKQFISLDDVEQSIKILKQCRKILAMQWNLG